MARKRKPTVHKGKSKLDGVPVTGNGKHPARVSGLFRNDPTFEDFRKILGEQREEDYRRAMEEIEPLRQEEAKKCSSSTPTRSRTTKTRTRS
jgi:hypothetical protein